MPGEPAIPAGAYTGRSLNVHLISPANYTFYDFKANETLTVAVTNPTGSRMTAYIALYRHNKWNVLGKLGEVGPGENRTLSYPLNFSYHGRTAETDQLGIAAGFDGTYSGNIIHVGENWAPYENRLASTLSLFGVPMAGLLLGILAMIMGRVFSVTQREHIRHRIFFISRPAELLADVITSPLFWLFELACGAVLVAIILFFTLSDISPDIGWLIFLLGGAAAIFMPVVYLVAAWAFKYYRRQTFRLMVSMFTWGIMATLIAFLINTACTLLIGAVVGKSVAFAIAAVLVAPVTEETSKGTGVLILSGRRDFGGLLDGILYGFAIGMGFAFIENWLYFAVNANPVHVGGVMEWAYDMLYRSLLDSLGHGCFTGATGAFVGYFKARRPAGGFAVKGFLLGLPVAMVLHSSFNLLDVIGSTVPTAFGIPLPLFDPLLTLVIFVFYICLGIYLQAREKHERPGTG
ncbi:PrsW family intramembrane metalloprotease [Methanocella paludicola]|nr:PrsW family intramembrane metalloprotease [Methanocella paludicola]